MTGAIKSRPLLTVEQLAVRDSAIDFARRSDAGSLLTIGGYAGTGKTTVAAEIARGIANKRIAFCCYTAKAAYVLREKLQRAGVFADCSTIHRLIYQPEQGRGGVTWRRVDRLDCDLLIVDEASMVGDAIYRDLKAFRVPIIAIGDHGQLPPIQGSLNLMAAPHLTLEKIHRQAEASPIIRLSVMARHEGNVPYGVHGDGVAKVCRSRRDIVREYGAKTLYLCGRNRTRVFVNERVRELQCRGPYPEPGDRVICLRNNYSLGVFNGVCGTILDTSYTSPEACGFVSLEDAKRAAHMTARIEMDSGELFGGDVSATQFGNENIEAWDPGAGLFDYGYCLTVHKAQGSEADNVVVFEERFAQMTDDNWRRWLYTAITRAKSRLLLVG